MIGSPRGEPLCMAIAAMFANCQTNDIGSRRNGTRYANDRIFDDQCPLYVGPNGSGGMKVDIGRRLAARHMLSAGINMVGEGIV